ncbi:MAG: DNA polymerase III subunit beta, partial [Acidimicrobiia bacterium]|nr:DNA polymerase III subunit beta [Acidimicrobiia bacterium]
MKFRAERDALLEAITTAGRAAATRGTALPALTGVRLEVSGDQLHLAGTDLDVTIQVQMQVAVGEPGVCVIPARLATDIVRGLDPGSVSFEVDDNEARIAAGPT